MRCSQQGWIEWHDIARRKSPQNRFMGRFIARLRDASLNEPVFLYPNEVRFLLKEWWRDHNTHRPHSRLGWAIMGNRKDGDR